MSAPCLQAVGKGVRLSVKVQPRAARSEIAGLSGRELRIRIAAPPVDDAANDALIRFLAETLALPRHSVRLIRGRASGHKLFEIVPLTIEQAVARLGLDCQ